MTQGRKNLQLALRRDKKTTLRMANSGDLLGSLPRNKMTDILYKIFRGGDIIVTLCYGKIQVPPPEMRPKIIEEYHSSLIGGHKGITKTYRRIRERITWPQLRDQITEFIQGCKSCFEKNSCELETANPCSLPKLRPNRSTKCLSIQSVNYQLPLTEIATFSQCRTTSASTASRSLYQTSRPQPSHTPSRRPSFHNMALLEPYLRTEEEVL